MSNVPPPSLGLECLENMTPNGEHDPLMENKEHEHPHPLRKPWNIHIRWPPCRVIPPKCDSLEGRSATRRTTLKTRGANLVTRGTVLGSG